MSVRKSILPYNARTFCTALCCAALLLISFASKLAAQPYELYGVGLPNVQVKPIDASLVTVTVGEQAAEVVAKDELNSFIAERALPVSSAAGLMPAALFNLYQRSLDAADAKVSAAALAALFDAAPELIAKEFAPGGLLTLDRSTQSIKDALRIANPSEQSSDWIKTRFDLLLSASARLALVDPEWLRANLAGFLISNAEAVSKRLLDEEVRRLAADDFTASQNIFLLAWQLFGVEDAQVMTMRALIGRFQELRDIETRKSYGDFGPLVDACRENALYAQVLYPRLAKDIILAAAQALEAGSALGAIKLLAKTDPKRSTPDLVAGVSRALEQLSGADGGVLLNGQSEEFVSELARVNPTVKDAALSALDRHVDWLLDRGKPDDVDAVLESIVEFRPDPSKSNDALRIKQANEFLKLNRRDAALRSVLDIQSGFGVLDRLRLGFSGLYCERSNFVLLFALFVFSTVAYIGIQVIKVTRRMRKRRRLEQERILAGMQAEALERASPRLREYIDCLAVLGLNKEATLRDIKSAFRSAMKRTHPDRQENVIGTATGDFVKITEAYQKALRLRSELKLN